VPAKRAEGLFGTTWVHVFEEDTAEGEVYRREDDDIPLSRRPRERIQLQPDGSARISVQGSDDRYFEQPASWSEEEGALVIRKNSGASSLRLVSQSPSRLIVRRES
jgi:hypothetical protein